MTPLTNQDLCRLYPGIYIPEEEKRLPSDLNFGPVKPNSQFFNPPEKIDQIIHANFLRNHAYKKQMEERQKYLSAQNVSFGTLQPQDHRAQDLSLTQMLSRSIPCTKTQKDEVCKTQRTTNPLFTTDPFTVRPSRKRTREEPTHTEIEKAKKNPKKFISQTPSSWVSINLEESFSLLIKGMKVPSSDQDYLALKKELFIEVDDLKMIDFTKKIPGIPDHLYPLPGKLFIEINYLRNSRPFTGKPQRRIEAVLELCDMDAFFLDTLVKIFQVDEKYLKSPLLEREIGRYGKYRTIKH